MKNSLLVPNLYGVFEIKSFTKNRIRLVINKLKNNRDEINYLKSNLAKIEGIYNFKIVESIGSITLEFNEKVIKPELMIGIVLKLLSLENELFKKRNGKLKNIFDNFMNATNISVYNKSKGLLDSKTAIGFFFLLFGIRKLKKQPTLPAGATLIWWSYNLLFKNKIDFKGNRRGI